MSEKCDQSLLKLVAYGKCAYSLCRAGEGMLATRVVRNEMAFLKNSVAQDYPPGKIRFTCVMVRVFFYFRQ